MKLTPHAPLAALNTLGLEAHCLWLAEVAQLDDLCQLRANSELNALPRLVLGGGSNILFCNDFSGLVVLNRMKGIELQDDGSLFKVRIDIRASEMVVDLRDNPDQCQGPTNLSRDGTVVAAQMAFKALILMQD